MLKSQKGVTLLEAILVSAITGWVMAYVGSQLMKYAEIRALEKVAEKIVDLSYITKEYALEETLLLSEPGEDGKDYIVNPIRQFEVKGLFGDSYDRAFITSGLPWYKKKECPEIEGKENILPNNILSQIIPCNYEIQYKSAFLSGVYFYFTAFGTLKYPSIKNRVLSTYIYMAANKNEASDLIALAASISDVKRYDGFNISDDNIYLGEAKQSFGDNSYALVDDETKIRSFSELLNDADPNAIQKFIDSLSGNKIAIGIEVLMNQDNYLRSDGATAMKADAALCWDSKNGAGVPCLSAFINPDHPEQNMVISEVGFAYGQDKKRTPPEVSYHTFVGGNPVYIPQLACPVSADGLNMKNMFVALSSSFSSGSANGTNFSDPSEIISMGTKGADGKHAFLSGMSLEWNVENAGSANSRWKIDGAVGIDAAYQAENNNSSVLRNPNSISFIAIRWCEEE